MACVRGVGHDEEEEDWKQQGLVVASAVIDNNNNNIININNKAPRLPRWTRQEILVLIQGKQVAENRVRRGRSVSGVEPKWATVSSYCKRHGVNRGAVQCRKRWSNLAGDFKKISEWESALTDDSESFWLMRNDVRREKKLPGFFDREVYDILDGNHHHHHPAAVADDDDTTTDDPFNIDQGDDENDTTEDAIQSPTNTVTVSVRGSSPVLFDSSRSAATDDALFNHPNPIPIAFPAPVPISAKHYEAAAYTTPTAAQPLTPGRKQKEAGGSSNPNPEIGSTSDGARKRRRAVVEDEAEELELEDELVKVLDKNGDIMRAHLEAHNLNLKLDREQRKEHANNVVAVLNRLAEALARIADKL